MMAVFCILVTGPLVLPQVILRESHRLGLKAFSASPKSDGDTVTYELAD